jgi:hypothetical protein
MDQSHPVAMTVTDSSIGDPASRQEDPLFVPDVGWLEPFPIIVRVAPQDRLDVSFRSGKSGSAKSCQALGEPISSIVLMASEYHRFHPWRCFG